MGNKGLVFFVPPAVVAVVGHKSLPVCIANSIMMLGSESGFSLTFFRIFFHRGHLWRKCSTVSTVFGQVSQKAVGLLPMRLR